MYNTASYLKDNNKQKTTVSGMKNFSLKISKLNYLLQTAL